MFALETLRLSEEVEGGFENPRGFGVSVAALSDLTGRCSKFCLENEDELEELIKVLKDTDRLVGFGARRFDIPVLTSAIPGAMILRARTIDLLPIFERATGRRVTLANLARHTLGVELESGISSPLEWRTGNRGAVFRRLEKKVKVIGELYLLSLADMPWEYVVMEKGVLTRRHVSITP